MANNHPSITMNNQSQAHNQNLRLISKNGSIHLAQADEHRTSPPNTDTIQLELNFNQATTDYH